MVNTAGQALRRVPLHLYLNAFRHEESTWYRGAPLGRFDSDRKPRRWGGIDIERLEQRVASAAYPVEYRAIAPDDGNPLDLSLIEVSLARPVVPGAELVLSARFTARLPWPVARVGMTDRFAMVAQWFPKLAKFSPDADRAIVRIDGLWNARQFHAPSEFSADFADYQVAVDLPAAWQISGPGRTGSRTISGGRTVTTFRLSRAIDFSFALGRALERRQRLIKHQGGVVGLELVALPGSELSRWEEIIARSLHYFEGKLSAYPYKSLSVVFPPWQARQTMGMEYPAQIVGTIADGFWRLPGLARWGQAEEVLVHELGHQFFYALLASDEQRSAFLDEGMTSYWTERAMSAVFGDRYVLGRRWDDSEVGRWSLKQQRGRIVEPIASAPTALYYPGSTGAQAYTRPALTFQTAERLFGRPAIDRLFAQYVKRHAFAHPTLDDLLIVARELGPAALPAFLIEAFSRKDLPDYRVVSARSRVYRAPKGDARWRGRQLSLREVVREGAGRDVVAWIRQGAWSSTERRVDGRAVRRRLAMRRGTAARHKEGAELYSSEVLLRGSSWLHLPVRVDFRFADGVQVSDRWDGRSAWRSYRFVRPARLERVQIDAAQKILLDIDPVNNGYSLSGISEARRDWENWLAGVTQFISTAVVSWF